MTHCVFFIGGRGCQGGGEIQGDREMRTGVHDVTLTKNKYKVLVFFFLMEANILDRPQATHTHKNSYESAKYERQNSY